MKKIKTTITWLCALCFLFTSMTFFACGKKDGAANQGGSEYSVSDSLESESSPDDETDSPVSSSPTPDDDESAENSAPPSNSSSSSSISSSSTSSSSKPSSSSNVTSAPSTQDDEMQYVRCTGDSVNIRSGAGTGYSVIGTVKKGTMYAIIGKTGSWYKTYYRNQVAYLSASYFSVVTIEKSTNSKVEKVLNEGYKLIGVPYVYGAVRVHDGTGKLLSGFSAQKFDCSSLVQYVFYKGANKLLQVHTRTQVKQGTYVKRANLQRGDCIFFTNEDRQYNTGVEKVGHVAIYLGNDYILHTASDYARIEKMTAYRWNFYIEARRFV